MMFLYTVFFAAHFFPIICLRRVDTLCVDGLSPDSFQYRRVKAAYGTSEDRRITVETSLSHTDFFAD